MKSVNKHDQFFLVDGRVVEKLVDAAEIKKSDAVLEIGAGRGVITREIARRAGRVIAVEIDAGFAQDLSGLPANVEVIFGNLLTLLDKIKFNKIVSNLPSSIVEPLFRILARRQFELMSALVPLKFLSKLNGPILSAYFKTKLVEKVGAEAFSPRPRTNWALVKVVCQTDPLAQKDYGRFIEKYLIEHPRAKLKNALMEAVVEISKSKGGLLTKNQAREIAGRLNLPADEMEKPLSPKTNLQSLSENLLKLF